MPKAQKVRAPKAPRPLAIGYWFKVPYDDEGNFTWLRVVENLPSGKVVMKTRSGHLLTVDRTLILLP